MLRSLLLVGLVFSVAANFTGTCPKECKCGWGRGNKQADCSYVNLQEIPGTLSPQVQNLDLTANNLSEIRRDAFKVAGLVNLKKLVLRDCKLQTIHKNGLSGLAIMTELDLSENQLKELHPDTFKETKKIWLIKLNDNLLEKLDDGLFNNLPYLQKVDLSNNKIKQLGKETFFNVPKLNILILNGNEMESMDADAFSSLDLYTLDVHENPWRCDCNLQGFRNLVVSKSLSMGPIRCIEPAKLRGKLWTDLESRDFACQPSIADQNASESFKSSGTNVTLSCQVDGNYLPSVNWAVNAQMADGNFQYQGEIKYYIKQSRDENRKIVNLTIIYAETYGNGE